MSAYSCREWVSEKEARCESLPIHGQLGMTALPISALNPEVRLTPAIIAILADDYDPARMTSFPPFEVHSMTVETRHPFSCHWATGLLWILERRLSNSRCHRLTFDFPVI
jgi:hypothetical protein